MSKQTKQTYRVCFCFRRRFKVVAAEAPTDVKKLFNDYSDNGVMTAENLQRFLVEVQKEENASLEDAQNIMNNLHELKILNVFHRRGLHLDAFFKYLFADINPPINPNRRVRITYFVQFCCFIFFKFYVIIICLICHEDFDEVVNI